MKHLLSDFDLSKGDIEKILALATDVKTNPKKFGEALKGKILGMVFQKPSTRTKASFEAAMYQLGGNVICLDPSNSQLGRGESLVNTAAVLSRYTHAIAVRLFFQQDLAEMANMSNVPMINALTNLYHPCQIWADLLTIQEKKGKLADVKLAYLGDAGNNIAHSLLISCSKMGMSIVLACPADKKYQPNDSVLSKVRETAPGATIEITSDPMAAVHDADILYTDTWVSMGMENEKSQRVNDLLPYQLNAALLSKAKKDALVMHCLPAYVGYEITPDVLYGANSVIYSQAENRLHLQKALFLYLLESQLFQI